MTKRRRLELFKRFLFVIIIAGIVLTHFFIPRLISEIRNPVVSLIKRNRNSSHKLSIDTNNLEITRKVISIKSFDGITLSARITYSNLDSPKGTIILLHGIRSNKDQFLSLSNFLSENGFNSVALDSRAHGDSEGDFCSFGVHEKRDVQFLIDHLSDNENLNHG